MAKKNKKGQKHSGSQARSGGKPSIDRLSGERPSGDRASGGSQRKRSSSGHAGRGRARKHLERIEEIEEQGQNELPAQPQTQQSVRPRGGPQAFLERISRGETFRPGARPRTATFDDRRGQKHARGKTHEWTPEHGILRERKPLRPSTVPKGWLWKSPEKETYKPASGADIRPRPSRRTREQIEPAGKNVAAYEGEVQKNRKGFAFLIREPEDVYIPAEFAEDLLTGDNVRVFLNTRNKEILRVDVLRRGIKSFIGTYGKEGKSHYVILRDKTMEERVVVDAPVRDDENLKALVPGNKVMTVIDEYEPMLRGRMVQDFGPELAPKFDTLAVVTRSQWPQEFSVQAQAQATEASRTIIQNATQALGKAGARRDLRDKPFVTIDGRDARDFDDAVYVDRTKSGYVLYVAIADVAEFVPAGSPLDREAFARATSVYFPDYVVPMLPEALSNEACSLKPNVDRLVVVCEMHYDLNGKKRSAKVYEGVINSKRRCIYEDVEEECRNGETFWLPSYELYRLIRLSRKERGAIDLDLPEAKIILDEEGETIDIRKAERLHSHRLIEEFMIAANEAVSELMEREGWPFVYRIHEPPKGESLEKFMTFSQAVGLKPEIGDGTNPKKISKFLESILAHPLSEVLSYLLLRSLKQARYAPQNFGHFGLASKAYTHFTSPIRRYPDLIVHRILKAYARREQLSNDELAEFQQYLTKSCEHCSFQERKADGLERSVEKVKKARFMMAHTGEVHAARVTNVTETGLFVELEQWFVEGMVPVDEIGEDYFEFNEERLLLYGRRSGKKVRIGDKVKVMVLRCDLDQGYVDFTLRFSNEDAEV